MPAYNDTPLATQQINQTQAPIRTNFQTLEQSFNINHVDFSDPNFGKHLFIQLVTQTPTLATNATEIGLYSKNGVTSGVPELYFQRASGAADSGYAITEASQVASGWSILPSGIMIQWGSFAPTMSGNTIAFPRVFPANCFAVVVTPALAATAVVVGATNFAVNNFLLTARIGSNNNATTIGGTFIAIGN